MASIEVIRLDFVDNVLETNDNRILPIAHLFDARGCETRDHRRAVLCLANRRVAKFFDRRDHPLFMLASGDVSVASWRSFRGVRTAESD